MNEPQITQQLETDNNKKKGGARIVVVLVVILIFTAIIGGALYFLFNSGDKLPEAPDDIMGTFSVSQPIDEAVSIQPPTNMETGPTVKEIGGNPVHSDKESNSSLEVDLSTPLNQTADRVIEDDSVQTPPEGQNNASEDSQSHASVEEIVAMQSTINDLASQITVLAESVASLKEGQDKIASQVKAIRVTKPVKKSVKHQKKRIKKVQKLPQVKAQTPPFKFISVEIWDGEQKAVISANNQITQLSKGESSSNWVLLDLKYPDRAEFKERTTGRNVVLLSDGRLPHGI